jgi:segregation and condensation protein B
MNQDFNLESKIESILFYTGEPMSIKKLAGLCDANEEAVISAVSVLKEKLENSGIIIIEKENEVMLGTPKEASTLIEKLRKDELQRDLSKASLDTISIILYKDKATRAEIDYIRGVNSSFILRNLMVRGLVEKESHPTDSRKYFYKPSFELLQYLGITNLQELPDHENISKIIKREAVATESNSEIQ